MPREPSAAILDPLRRLIGRQSGSTLTDAQLVENFVARRDEASFEVLVWRHGAMVFALCQRILRDAHEAEDAFQAAFLVFARKAGGIGRGEAVAPWLYKVAYRIALRLRAARAKRGVPGEPPAGLPAPTGDDTDWHDLRPVLDDEIARLPEKYRAPFVLCYLEGRTNEEAAAQLGCPKGTVLSRLSRGRERLRARLSRRGVALTATALALTLSHNAAQASVPAALVSPTVGAAVPFAAGTATTQIVSPSVAALTTGALKAMTLVKIKVATAVLALAMLGTGLVWAANGGETPAPVATAPVAPPTDEPLATPADEDRDRERPPAPAAPALVGKVMSVAKDGKSFTVETPPTERGGEPGKATVKLGEKAALTFNGVGFDRAKPTEGYQAQVWFEANSKDTAATVAFHGPEGAGRAADRFGAITDVAKDGKSITLEVRAPGRPERGAEPPKVTIPFDAKTVVSFSNVAKDGAKFVAGQAAQVWFADDGKTAGKVQVYDRGEDRGRNEKRPDVMGKVTRTDGKKLVIEGPPAERGGEPVRTTVAIDDKAAVVFHNVPTDGAKLAAGMQAQVWLAEGSKDTAAKVFVTGTVPERWTTVTGKVVAVGKDAKSVTLEQPPTVRGEDGKRVEVKLTEKTKFAFFGVGLGEAKIAEGMMGQLRLLDGSTDTASHATFGKHGARER